MLIYFCANWNEKYYEGIVIVLNLLEKLKLKIASILIFLGKSMPIFYELLQMIKAKISTKVTMLDNRTNALFYEPITFLRRTDGQSHFLNFQPSFSLSNTTSCIFSRFWLLHSLWDLYIGNRWKLHPIENYHLFFMKPPYWTNWKWLGTRKHYEMLRNTVFIHLDGEYATWLDFCMITVLKHEKCQKTTIKLVSRHLFRDFLTRCVLDINLTIYI